MNDRKPPIYLLVIFPLLLGGTFATGRAMIHLYMIVKHIDEPHIPNAAGILVTLPALILWIPIGLCASNCILYIIPPLRRTAERYVQANGKPNFRQTQIQMGKAILLVSAICIPLIFIGFLL